MKKICAAAVWGLILAPVSGLAADLSPMPVYGDSGGQPLVQIGTGWYIRGDVGASLDNAPTLSFDPTSLSAPPPASVSPTWGSNSTKTDFVASLGVGYKFNTYLRADATFDYRTTPGLNATATGIICPYTAAGLTSQSALDVSGKPVQIGYAYNQNDTCNAAMQVGTHNYTGLVNGYIDLPGYWGITPYVGAGVGVNVASTSGNLTYTKSSDGTPYRADLTPTGTFPFVWVDPLSTKPFGSAINPQPKIPFAPQNWDRTFKSTKYSFAFDLTAGIGIALSSNTTLDVSYRYVNLGSTTMLINPETGATVSQKNTAQEVRVGLRYFPDLTE
jgi:opacity protein-like surface antigen